MALRSIKEEAPPRKTADVLSRLLPCGAGVSAASSGPATGLRRMRARGSALGLRTARVHCAKLRKEAGDGVPIAHLRAAEQHLAVVERWLLETVHGKTGALSIRRACDRAEAERLATLSLEFGPCSEEDERTFISLFGQAHHVGDDGVSSSASSTDEASDRDDEEERLLVTFSGSVLASQFFHQGLVYLSSSRMCFHSSVMGIQTSLSIPWEDMKSLLLMPPQNTSVHSIRCHRVRVTLNKAAAFAGEELQKLDLRVFSPRALGRLHKCASYFTGFGLFDYATLRSSKAWTMRSMSLSDEPGSRSLGEEHLHFFKTAQDVEDDMVVWELQRRPTAFSSRWVAPYLLHDGKKSFKWMSLGKHYVPHPSLPKGLQRKQSAASKEPPISEVELLGRRCTCRWRVVVDGTTDEDGWQYALDFHRRPSLWAPTLRCWAQVRRRRWVPDCEAVEDEDDLEKIFERLPTTIFAQKGLAPRTNGSSASGTGIETLLQIDLGKVSLQALGEKLLQDDWTSDDSIMTMYFREIGARDIQVGPWAVGSAVDKVKGRVRSVEMCVPVPPAPMCPKETRCAATWHVVVDDTRVVLESVNMSLDVPYGDSFKVVACDTFKECPATGTVKMERTCGVEWVKSSWMKSLVEANVPVQVAKAGEHVAEVIRRSVARDA